MGASATGLPPAPLPPLGNVVRDLPRRAHSLADLPQIAAAVIAHLAWENARRAPR